MTKTILKGETNRATSADDSVAEPNLTVAFSLPAGLLASSDNR